MEQKATVKRSRLSLDAKEALWGFLFVSPWFIGFLAFTSGPLFFSLYASFTNYDVTSQMDWIGLRNYEKMFTRDRLFWKSFNNTLYFVVVSVPLTTIAAVFMAALLNQRIFGMRIFRTIYYLPAVLSGVGVYILWMMILNPESGLINTMLGWVGIQGPAWMQDPDWTKNAIILMKMWAAGGGMLLFLAALQGVPQHLYEAAEIDGASTVRKFWHVTVPMITPVIFYNVVTSIIGGFQIFQEGYVMSENADQPGSPMNSLLFYNLHMYLKAFRAMDMGYGMAMAWFLFFITLAITVINLVTSKYWVHYEGGDQR